MELQLHDRVKMKKPHPCGCAIFEVTRLGVDYKLKCTGCGHQIMVARRLVEPVSFSLYNTYKRRRLCLKNSAV